LLAIAALIASMPEEDRKSFRAFLDIIEGEMHPPSGAAVN
jgi:hypothetical protein